MHQHLVRSVLVSAALMTGLTVQAADMKADQKGHAAKPAAAAKTQPMTGAKAQPTAQAKPAAAHGATHANNAANAAVTKLTFTNKEVGGKKVWLPANAKVKQGSMVEITLVNTLADPHGFEVPGLVKPVVVPGKQQTKVSFKADHKGDVKFRCHMHPAHVGGSITVE